MLHRFGVVIALVCCAGWPIAAHAAATVPAQVAVFPLQELGAGRNEVNLPVTRALTDKLAARGNEITSHETVIAFMAHNRIRTVGYLESFHISRVRQELGVAFVLLGTVSQQKERPQPSLGVTLQLVRTSDARTIWSYVGHFSVGDERRVLGIGEPRSVADLQQLLLEDILGRWPWEVVREAQQAGVINIDAFTLEPALVRPGGEINSRVRLRNAWLPGRAPRVFFKADDQLHAAKAAADGSTYEATWISGEKDGRFPVTLILEWPLYGRSETALLGAYLVDGTPPLFEIELRGTQLFQGTPTFRNELVIMPRPLVRKQLERWRLAFRDDAGKLLGADEGTGNLPERFIWKGRRGDGYMAEDGDYEVVIEAWDRAGNMATASRQVALRRSMPGIELAVTRSGQEMVVDLESAGKVPLAYWRMEMWTKEGKILGEAEGQELPAKIGIELPDAGEDAEIEGYLVVKDVLGNLSRRKVGDLFQRAAAPAAAVKKEEPVGISETWVDEF